MATSSTAHSDHRRRSAFLEGVARVDGGGCEDGWTRRVGAVSVG
ncbi:hypothetical protein [Pendulispora rubella]